MMIDMIDMIDSASWGAKLVIVVVHAVFSKLDQVRQVVSHGKAKYVKKGHTQCM